MMFRFQFTPRYLNISEQHVTRSSLLQILKERDLFQGSSTSLGIILKEIGFHWKKDNPRRGLMELPHIANPRVTFLQSYVNNLCNNYWQFVYLDKT